MFLDKDDITGRKRFDLTNISFCINVPLQRMHYSICPKLFVLTCAIILLVPSGYIGAQTSSSLSTNSLPSSTKYVPGELIIKYKTTAPTEDEVVRRYKVGSARKVLREEQIARTRQQIKDSTPSIGDKEGLDKLYLIKSEQQDVNQLIEEVKKDPEIEYAEPNFILHALAVPNDPSFSRLWGFNNSGQTGGSIDADIDAPEAWDKSYDSGPVVGIIDSGIDYNHEDLRANIWTNNIEALGRSGIDDDNNGYIDDIHGFDFANNDSDPMDDDGHGTHLAGTIAAVGENGIGISGVNYHGKVAALKFLDASGSGTTEFAIRAIQYANLMGFKITNNSWGGGGYSQALYNVISAANQAGNLFIAAAGNDASNNDTRPSYPDSYNLPNIISVAATDKYDKLATFSNFGPTSVDIGAPGVDIYSTIPNNRYTSYSGTSMAAPHVSGAAAYIWGAFPSATGAQIKDKLLSLSDPLTSLSGKIVSGKRLNLNNPLGSAAPIPSPTPSPTGVPSPTPTPVLSPTPIVSPTLTPNQPANSLTVSSLSMRYTTLLSAYRYVYTTATVKNKSTNIPISSARVNIKLTYPSGRVSYLSGYTNSNGQVSLRAFSRELGTYVSSVTGVSKSGYQYLPSITSASLIVN